MAAKPKKTDAAGEARPTHVALLRGVNVGGKNMIAMSVLAGMFERAGAKAVKTYIQSGNVLFAPGEGVTPEGIAGAVRGSIKKKLGFEPAIVVRNAKEMGRVAAAHPFEAHASDGKGLYVGFLDARPPASAVKALDPNRSPGDMFEVRGTEMYLLYKASNTKLTNLYIDKTLGATSTMRNWNTVQTLAEMLNG